MLLHCLTILRLVMSSLPHTLECSVNCSMLILSLSLYTLKMFLHWLSTNLANEKSLVNLKIVFSKESITFFSCCACFCCSNFQCVVTRRGLFLSSLYVCVQSRWDPGLPLAEVPIIPSCIPWLLSPLTELPLVSLEPPDPSSVSLLFLSCFKVAAPCATTLHYPGMG